MSLTSDNIIKYVLGEIPEFEPVYLKLTNRETEVKRNIDKPQRIFYHLGYFAIHAIAKANTPDLAGPNFNNLDELLSRIMNIVERAASSSDLEVARGVKDGFIKVMYLMQNYQSVLIPYAGPKTLALLEETS